MKTRMLLSVAAVVLLAAAPGWAQSAGKKLFGEKCAMCHQVKGKGGALGPDLSKVASRMNDAALREKLINPKQAKPDSTMPAFQSLPKKDLDALIKYLKTLK